jgi:hypothetical protein
MALERIVHNVTVALRCVDGNSRRVLAAPIIRAAGEHFVRNRSGDHVLLDRAGLPELAVTVEDPTGAYLPRRAVIDLPRDPNPANAAAADSLFRPAELALYPAPAAVPASGWAVVRATVVNAATDAVLPGALLRVVRTSDGAVLARGVTEWRGRAAGEALLAVPGVPAITFGPANGGDDGAVLVSQIAVTIEAIFDPQAGALLPNPDDLETRRAELPQGSADAAIGAGAASKVRITVAVD